jgi:hypothetical protein
MMKSPWGMAKDMAYIFYQVAKGENIVLLCNKNVVLRGKRILLLIEAKQCSR